ncbi:MAG: rhomboid family intramembrane serine protease [Bacteroidota bacterium]
MTYTEQQYRQKITLGSPGNTLITLIAICLIFFVGLAFMKAIWYFKYPKELALGFYYRDILRLFVMPADADKMISQPWTIITHMFVHDNFWKILSNMLWLWCFGYILQDMTGNKKIIPVFIYGALGGAIAFTLAYNFLPSLQAQLPVANAIGASAGVMAVAVVTTMVSPGYRIFPLLKGGLPLWVLTILYVVSDLATTSINDTGNLIGHLAGAFTGFLFIFFLRMGYDWSGWMNNFFDWVNNLFNPDKPKKGKSIKEELFYKSSTAPYKKTMNLTEARIDAILDKIHDQGYNSLTEEEKELLKKASMEDGR